MTHWDMLNNATKFEFSLFNTSHCVICSQVWRFEPRDRSAGKGPLYHGVHLAKARATFDLKDFVPAKVRRNYSTPFKIPVTRKRKRASTKSKKYKNQRNLRSNNQYFLRVPKSRTTTFGDRAFSVCAPKLWNNLPTDVKSSPSIDIFKKKLKTYLFSN